MKRAAWITSTMLLFAAVGPAAALNSSPRPEARSDAEQVLSEVAQKLSPTVSALPSIDTNAAVAAAIAPTPRARVNTTTAVSSALALMPQGPSATAITGLALSPRPTPRGSRTPARVQPVLFGLGRSKPRSNEPGKICGHRKIIGYEIDDISSSVRGCGVRNPVKVTEVSGIKLSTPATMNCQTAQALRKWVDGGAKKSIGRTGGGLVQLQVAGHYVCRTRNHQPGAKISEHGKGNAIDISGFRLADGTTISVLNDWGRRKNGRILKKIQNRACGPFKTVLGPESDRFHKDHFHFDMQQHRGGGTYCR